MSDLKVLIGIAKAKNKAKADRKDTIIKKYKDSNKIKKLTQAQEIALIKEILEIDLN